MEKVSKVRAGKTIRLGDKLITTVEQYNRKIKVHGQVVGLVPKGNSIQIILLAEGASYRRSKIGALYHFSIDNVNWKKDTSDYKKKGQSHTESQSRVNYSRLFSSQQKSKKYEKKGPPTYTSRTEEIILDQRIRYRRGGQHDLSTQCIYTYDLPPVDIDNVGTHTFESMVIPPRPKGRVSYYNPPAKQNTFVYSPSEKNTDESNSTPVSDKFDQKVKLMQEKNLEYQKSLESALFNGKSDPKPRTYIQFIESLKPKQKKEKVLEKIPGTETIPLGYSLSEVYVSEDNSNELAKFSVFGNSDTVTINSIEIENEKDTGQDDEDDNSPRDSEESQEESIIYYPWGCSHIELTDIEFAVEPGTVPELYFNEIENPQCTQIEELIFPLSDYYIKDVPQSSDSFFIDESNLNNFNSGISFTYVK